MRRPCGGTAAVLLVCSVMLLGGCERHYLRSEGLVSSDGGGLSEWSRPLEGCSPDPTDGLPPQQSSTLFSLYWNNPVRFQLHPRHNPPIVNKLKGIEVRRGPNGLTGSVQTTLIAPDITLDRHSCSTFRAGTAPGPPVIEGGRPTVSGTLDLDCRVSGSHLTAKVRFSGCEY